ncbi:MAG: XdhC family protein [Clostridiaceae bacterium]|nr:XdhC family protein [Eubacteriales bacterium]
MEKLFCAMCDALVRGEDLVLCTIIASSGSTPRGSGAKMAVFADGSALGTVGGGAVEYQSTLLAKKALTKKAAFTHGFDLSPSQTAGIGMICGGKVVVYFQFFKGGDASAVELFSAVEALFSQSKNTWLVTEISEGCVRRMGFYSREDGPRFLSGMSEEELSPMIRPRAVLQKGEPSYYVEPLTVAGYVYVFGGGHVAQELVPVIAHVGFAPVVYEDRPEFASRELFPEAAHTIVGSFGGVAAHVTLTRDDYAVIMTRGHQADFEVLRQVLLTPASYVGVIGSRSKIAITNARLIEAGIPEAELKRIHAPIGLPILAETPAEIAISVAAELILHRAQKTGGNA